MQRIFQISWVLWCGFLGPSAFAYSHEICDGLQKSSGRSCTSKMRQIENEFSKGNSKFILNRDVAYSGSCYHLSSDYDPETSYLGVFAFKTREVSTNLRARSEALLETKGWGLFGFFVAENPYAGKSSRDVLNELSRKTTSFPVAVSADEAEVVFSGDESFLSYRFRSSADLRTLYLIGTQEFLTSKRYVFCEMQRHEIR